MIHRDKMEAHKKQWTILHNRIVEDNRLSLKAKGALWYLLSRPPTYKVSKRRLVRELTAEKVVVSNDIARQMKKDNRCSIETLFEELVSCGYIVDQEGVWHVYETPIDVGNRDQSKSHTNSSGGNQQQNVQKICIDSVEIQPTECGNSAQDTSELRIVLKDNQTIKQTVGSLANSETEDNKALIDNSIGKPSNEPFSEEIINVSEESAADAARSPRTGPSIDEQARTILRHHPSKTNAEKALASVKAAILQYGYDGVLIATKAYARQVKDSRTLNPTWCNKWFGSKQYEVYLPLEPDSEEAVDVSDQLSWSDEATVPLEPNPNLPDLTDEDNARIDRDINEAIRRRQEEATRN